MEEKIKNQVHTENYSVYNADCMQIVETLPDKSIDLSIYSPPFAGLYKYSSDPRDMSNCENKEHFLQGYEFLVEQIARITKSGRITAVHCTDLFNHACYLDDLPHDIIEIHKKYGFHYRNRITVWKEPLRVRTRTMVQSLMHKFIVEDSTKCFTAMPDYVLIFTKRGENETPVTHKFGIDEYYGDVPILKCMVDIWNRANKTNFNEEQLWQHLQNTKDENKITKLNHYIWQRYASAVWDDVRVDNILPFREAKEEDDEKHVHPLQLDVIARLVELYSNPDEIVFTPFMGVGSEVYQAVKMGRKAIGVELKDSYFKQAIMNLDSLKNEVKDTAKQGKLKL